MEEKKKIPGLLDMIPHPGFYVTDYLVTAANTAATGMGIFPCADVREWIRLGLEEYSQLEEGCLCLTLCFGGRDHCACVTRRPEGDLFLLEQEDNLEEFRAMALAARELRLPLSNAMGQMEQLLASLPEESRNAAVSMSRSLYQMLRTIGNMSDTGNVTGSFRPEVQNIPAVIQEIFDKAQVLAAHTGIRLTFHPLEEMVLGLVDAPQLERAIYNILSNALKFTPAGGSVEALLSRKGTMLRLSLQDSGSGIHQDVLQNLFYRYLRQPGIEDSRYGIGLGMVLIRRIAANHGGTVFIDRSPSGGTRVTLTLAIRQDNDTILSSPVRRPDYTGERDHGLVELSDCLPAHLYNEEF